MRDQRRRDAVDLELCEACQGHQGDGDEERRDGTDQADRAAYGGLAAEDRHRDAVAGGTRVGGEASPGAGTPRERHEAELGGQAEALGAVRGTEEDRTGGNCPGGREDRDRAAETVADARAERRPPPDLAGCRGRRRTEARRLAGQGLRGPEGLGAAADAASRCGAFPGQRCHRPQRSLGPLRRSGCRLSRRRGCPSGNIVGPGAQ
mmetsp:Transcript_84066/g.243016  ORF Transcript_84066/g.243016 Transcript_84066/m.243016 type:complete len:206 (+) Transcript_84066:1042-1659(+)